MNFDEYQDRAMATAVYPMMGDGNLAYTVLGLAGECGEVANTYKKVLRGDNGRAGYAASQAHLCAELGDVLWYVAATCTELGVSLAYVAECNLLKLQARSESGTIQGNGDAR